uniref:Uncharacterized protein n=1 Tax=Solanum tuberosum TaxID=4113 RepID=M1D0S7_SOLTU
MLFPSLRGCCKFAALSELLRVQKLSNFSLFKATAAAVFWGFQPNFVLRLRPFKAAVAATFLGFQPNNISFLSIGLDEVDSKRRKCKR